MHVTAVIRYYAHACLILYGRGMNHSDSIIILEFSVILLLIVGLDIRNCCFQNANELIEWRIDTNSIAEQCIVLHEMERTVSKHVI